MTVKGTWAVITGASSGIGRAFALELTGRGFGAVVALTRRFLPRMIERGRGLVINVASILGFMPVPYFATYAATKAFVLHFSEALSVELSGTGVQVLASSPGVTKTDFARTSGSGEKEGSLPQLTAEHVARVSMKAADERRVVRPIGAAYRLLAFLVAITPRALMRRIMGRIFAPGQISDGATRVRAVHGDGKWRGGDL